MRARCFCAKPIAASGFRSRWPPASRTAEDRIEHRGETLVAQRIFGIALGYEDLNDHDELRHDPVLGLASGKLEARRIDCAVAKRIVLDLDGSKASCYGLYNFALQM